MLVFDFQNGLPTESTLQVGADLGQEGETSGLTKGQVREQEEIGGDRGHGLKQHTSMSHKLRGNRCSSHPTN